MSSKRPLKDPSLLFRKSTSVDIVAIELFDIFITVRILVRTNIFPHFPSKNLKSSGLDITVTKLLIFFVLFKLTPFSFSSFSQMRFYFHMSGDGIGTLSVFSKSEGHLHLLLTLTGDQGNYWQMKEIPLSSSRDFQVMFEGKVGRNPKVDICLDDITFSPGCLLASSATSPDNTPSPPPGTQFTLLDICFISTLAVSFRVIVHPPIIHKNKKSSKPPKTI